MSFYTSLVFYRPRTPPAVTAANLARFIAAIHETGVFTDRGFQSLGVKFGRAIDQDELGTTWEEEIAPRLVTVREIEWDIHLDRCDTVRQVIDPLESDGRTIYRASVSLGMPTDAVLDPITRKNSPENDCNYEPDSLSIEVGPIEIFDLKSEAPALCGWIGLSLTGYGYLFPWTFRDVVERLDANAEVGKLTALCRSHWPVPSTKPEAAIVKARRQLGTVWPYDTGKPWDWYWGVQESG